MKKIVFALLFCSLWRFSCAQAQRDTGPESDTLIMLGPPDDTAILHRLTANPHYYDLLKKRFRRNNKTLDINGLRDFYYGACFQSDIDGTEIFEFDDRFSDALSREMPSRMQLKKVDNFLREYSCHRPTELAPYLYRIVISIYQFNRVKEKKISAALDKLCLAVCSSGNGMDLAHSVCVVNRGDPVILHNSSFYLARSTVFLAPHQCYEIYHLREDSTLIPSYCDISRCCRFPVWRDATATTATNAEKMSQMDISIGQKVTLLMEEINDGSCVFSILSIENIGTDSVARYQDTCRFFSETPVANTVDFVLLNSYGQYGEKLTALYGRSHCMRNLRFSTSLLGGEDEDYELVPNSGMPARAFVVEHWYRRTTTISLSDFRVTEKTIPLSYEN